MECLKSMKMNELHPCTVTLTNSVEQKTLDTKEHLRYNSISMKFKTGKTIYGDRNWDNSLPFDI